MIFTRSFGLSCLLAMLFLTGCVTKKKYADLEKVKDLYKDEIEVLKNAKAESEETRESMIKLQSDLKTSIRDREELTVRLSRIQEDYDNLTNRYNLLLDENSAILSASAYEKKVLQEEIGARDYQLDNRDEDSGMLNAELKDREQKLNELQNNLLEREARILEMENLLDSKDAQLQSISENIDNALRGLSSADLSMEERNGKLYVSLSQNLLFKSGSDKLDKRGKEVIQQVTSVLTQNPDLKVTVEGHTDSDGSEFANWKLSTSRALAVVKEMRNAGIQPERLTASGRSYFAPVRPNDTPDNKAANRRTEIILEPDLNALFEVLGNE